MQSETLTGNAGVKNGQQQRQELTGPESPTVRECV